MIRTACLMVFIGLSLVSMAQNDWRTYQRPESSSAQIGRGSGISVFQSPEITALSQRFKAEHSGKANLKGYRVQIFVGERARASELKSQAEGLFPGTAVEINYWAPNFRVRLGNFRTYLEADAFLQQVKGTFNSAYIVPDEIAPPPIY